MTSDTNLGSLVEVAVEIADRRLQVLEELRAALLSEDDGHALELARQLTGLDPTSCKPVLKTGRKRRHETTKSN
jgi:hypothetical protein